MLLTLNLRQRLASLAAVAAVSMPLSTPALAQTVPPPSQEDTEVEAVVVTARRIGVPVWRVSQGGATIILVGHIDRVPRGAAWNPTALEEAVGLADSVVLPARNRASLADLGRVIYRARSVVRLPKGKTVGDYITSELAGRLQSLQARGALDRSYLKSHPSSLALDLRQHIGAADRGGVDAADVVRAAARTRKVTMEPITVLGADKLLDSYFEQGPAGSVPCLEASASAAEAGSPAVRARIESWTKSRSAEVLASPVEKAISACQLGHTPELVCSLRAQWRAVVQRKLTEPGVTLGVAPLEYLAEDGGILDSLAEAGLEVEGPRWREDPAS